MKYKLVIMLIMMRIGGGFPILQGMGFSTSANVDTLDLTMKLDAYIKQYTDLDIFSGVVLIASDGEPMYHKPFGLSNREKGIPVTLDSKFLIGSMNKSFTQVVILQNSLSLDPQHQRNNVESEKMFHNFGIVIGEQGLLD